LPVRDPPAHALIATSPAPGPAAQGRANKQTSQQPVSQENDAMTKPAELREQTDEQLELLLRETQQNLFRLRLQSETERLEAPSEIIKAKREIARIKTILRLREIERTPAATPVAAASS
jgi:large subunit ribosomal protein L29